MHFSPPLVWVTIPLLHPCKENMSFCLKPNPDAALWHDKCNHLPSPHPAFTTPSLYPQVWPPTFLPRLLTLLWEDARGKSLAWVWAWCRESTNETERGEEKENWEECHWQEHPPNYCNAFSSTASSLCCSFKILPLFTFLYLTPSLSPVPISLPPSLPVHSALLVCCNGPWGWSWLRPTKYKTSMTDSRAKRLDRIERERKCCFPSVYTRQRDSAGQLTIKQLKDEKVRLSRD